MPSPTGQPKLRKQTIREKSFSVIGPKLFNLISPDIQNLNNVSVDTFKNNLDKYLLKIPDQPVIDDCMGKMSRIQTPFFKKFLQ